jgi:hypothetical protein
VGHGQEGALRTAVAQRKMRRMQFDPAHFDLERSRSFKIAIMFRAADGASFRYSPLSWLSGVSIVGSVIPIMAFMGVRISWLMLARNWS